MRRRRAGHPLLATFLVAAALLVNEVATFGYGCRVLKADCVMAVAAAAVATPKRGGTTVLMRAAPPGPGEGRVYGESKRLVPQGPNPLHN